MTKQQFISLVKKISDNKAFVYECEQSGRVYKIIIDSIKGYCFTPGEHSRVYQEYAGSPGGMNKFLDRAFEDIKESLEVIYICEEENCEICQEQDNKEKYSKKVFNLKKHAQSQYLDGYGTSNPNFNAYQQRQNVEVGPLPATMSNDLLETEHNYDTSIPQSESQKDKIEKCQHCGSSLLIMRDGHADPRCPVCQQVNTQHSITMKRNKNKKHRKALNVKNIKEAAAGNSTFLPSKPNSNNTPYGRLDLTEDERMMPWESLRDGFESEFNTDKQKSGFISRLVRVRDPDGKTKLVRIKRRIRGISPSNVYEHRGRVKRQPRYNPADGKNGEGYGAWYHNRGFGSWYQNDYGNRSDFSAGELQRPTLWSEYLDNRGPNMMKGLIR